MPVWSFDGYPVCRWVPDDGGAAELRVCPGYGPTVLYHPGQAFQDDVSGVTLTYEEALQLADVVTTSPFDPAVSQNTPSPGPLAHGLEVPAEVPGVGFPESDSAANRPPQVPAPRGNLGPTPDPGDVVITQTHGWSPPSEWPRSAGGTVLAPPNTMVPSGSDREASNAIVEQLNGVTAGLQSLLGSVPQNLKDQLSYVTNSLTALKYADASIFLPLLKDIQSKVSTAQTGSAPDLTAQLRPVLDAIGNLARHLPPDPTAQLTGISQQIANLRTGLTEEQAAQLAGVASVAGQIEDTVSGIAGSLQGKLDAQATRIESRVGQIADNVTQQIGADVQQAEQVVTDAERTITADLGQQTAAIEQTVQQSATAIASQIGAQIDTIAGTIGDDFKAGSQLVSGAVGDVATAIGGLKLDPVALMADVYQFGANAWPTWAEPLRQLVEGAVRGTLDSLEGDADQIIAPLLAQVTQHPDTPPLVTAVLGELTSSTHAVGLVGKLALVAFVVHEVFAGALQQPLEFFRQLGARSDPREVPGLEASALARSRGLIDPALAQELGYRKGFAQQWSDLAAELSRELLSPDEIVAARLRGYITPDQMGAQLRRRGFSGEDADTLYHLATEVPSPADLVGMLRREVFTPQISVPYGHFAEYPTDPDPVTGKTADDWFAKVGFDHEVASLFWASHWELPSNTQGFEMYQRGFITQDQLKLLLRANNIVPGWRDNLIKLAYHPLTRVDVRRMYQLGVLTADELPKRYMDLGYDQTNAQSLADFTVKNAKTTTKQEEGVFNTAIRSRTIAAYEQGTLDDATARDLLVGVGFESSYVEEFQREARTLRAARNRGRVADQLLKLYASGVGPGRDETRSQLVGIGLESDVVDQELQLADVDLALVQDREIHRHHRELTRAEITAAYRDGLTPRAAALQELEDSGYAPDAAETLLALEDRKTERELVRADLDAIHAQYVRGAIDRATASGQLDALHLPTRSRQAYLTRWDAEKRKAPPTLTHGELRALYVRGAIAPANARAQLVQTGLAVADVDTLLGSWETDRVAALARLTDAEIKRLADAKSISQPEVVTVLLARGLGAHDAAALAATFFA